MSDFVEDLSPDRKARRQEVTPGEFAPEVYSVDAVCAAVAQHRMFLAGSGRLTLAAAGNVRGTFTNPAGSGRTCFIARIAGMSTATGYLSLRRNPSTGLPVSAARPTLNAVLGSATNPVGMLKVDTDLVTALGGGTDTGIVLGAPANQRLSIELPPLVVLPGASLGLGVSFAGAADMTISVYWFEE